MENFGVSQKSIFGYASQNTFLIPENTEVLSLVSVYTLENGSLIADHTVLNPENSEIWSLVCVYTLEIGSTVLKPYKTGGGLLPRHSTMRNPVTQT